MTSVLSLRPSKKSPKKARCFWPVCNSTRFLIRFIYTLDKSTDVITPMSYRTADATAASARSEVIYLSHAIANAEIFYITQQQQVPALALENSGVTWVGKLLPGSVIAVYMIATRNFLHQRQPF